MNNRKTACGKPLASISLFLAAVLLVPAIANGQRKRSSKTRLSRDEQIEAALRKRTQKIQDQYCRDLVRIANWAALQGLKKEATGLADRIKEINPGYSRLEDVQEKIEKAEQEGDAAKNEKNGKSLLTRLKSADKKQGVELVKLATGCMKVGLFTRSFDMISHVLEISPDDSKARKILGYKKDTKTKEWISTWEYAKRKKYFLSKEGWFEKKKKKDSEDNLDDEEKGEEERLVFVLLRFNRYLVRIERKAKSSGYWSVVASIGCTKEGVPFVRKSNGPKCIVTGGYGSMTVQHKGKMYYIC